jgi:hypothetical protein
MKYFSTIAVILSALLVGLPLPAQDAKTATQASSNRASVIRDCAGISALDQNLAPVSAVCEMVKAMDRALPNFVCKQTTQRYFPFSSRSRRSDERIPTDIVADTVSATVTYEGGVDQYADVRVGGKSGNGALTARPITSGNFASELLSIFLEENAAIFIFHGEKKSRSGPEYVFEFRISGATPLTYREGTLETHPDVQGVLRVSKETGEVRVLDMFARKIDRKFFADHLGFSTTFGKVAFGDAGEFPLPKESESTLCNRDGVCNHSLTRWSDCKKLGVKTRMIVGVE